MTRKIIDGIIKTPPPWPAMPGRDGAGASASVGLRIHRHVLALVGTRPISRRGAPRRSDAGAGGPVSDGGAAFPVEPSGQAHEPGRPAHAPPRRVAVRPVLRTTVARPGPRTHEGSKSLPIVRESRLSRGCEICVHDVESQAQMWLNSR